MTPDLDLSLQLADRLTSKRLPRMASFLVITAGLTTATLLILAAGNARTTAVSAVLAEPTGPRAFIAVADTGTGQTAANDSIYHAAVSAMRGTIDLAANRAERRAELH